MICTELYNGQGLGNQLWTYTVMRILAQKNNCDFSCLGKEVFKGKDFIELDFGTLLRNGKTLEGGPAYILPEHIIHYYKEQRDNLIGTNIDISRTDYELLKIKPYTKIDGNCQSTKYLSGFREDILQWIHIKKEYDQYIPPENSCILHIRCGDFKKIKRVFLPISYYKQAIEHIKKLDPNVQFYCVTDEPDFIREFLPEVSVIGSSLMQERDANKASHHFGGPLGIDFCLLLRAKYLIIPNSSFSWWAAYLNTTPGKVVIAPKYWADYNESNGYWSSFDMVTDGFTYLDRNGNSFSADECEQEKALFEKNNSHIFVPVFKNNTETCSATTYYYTKMYSFVFNEIKKIVKPIIKKINLLTMSMRKKVNKS